MIKCNVTACGTISSSAEEKQSKDGEKFISFGMIVPLLGKDGTAKEVWVTVSRQEIKRQPPLTQLAER